jgi:CBS domain-containing protein
MKLRDIMTKQVQEVPPEATLQEAAQLMKSIDTGALPVCDHHRLIGMITDRDITIRGTASGQSPQQAHVSDVMTNDLIFCYEDEDVEEAARLMEARQIRRLPVLDRSKRLVGIVSLGDIAVRQHNDALSGEVLEQVSQPVQQHLM